MFYLAVVDCLVYFVDMYIARATWPSSNGKSYESIYLRESYRDGTHVRKRNIANLTHCDPQEIAAIELALRHKNDLTVLAADSDEGNQYSGLIVISIPGWRDQSSERSDAGFCIL